MPRALQTEAPWWTVHTPQQQQWHREHLGREALQEQQQREFLSGAVPPQEQQLEQSSGQPASEEQPLQAQQQQQERTKRQQGLRHHAQRHHVAKQQGELQWKPQQHRQETVVQLPGRKPVKRQPFQQMQPQQPQKKQRHRGTQQKQPQKTEEQPNQQTELLQYFLQQSPDRGLQKDLVVINLGLLKALGKHPWKKQQQRQEQKPKATPEPPSTQTQQQHQQENPTVMELLQEQGPPGRRQPTRPRSRHQQRWQQQQGEDNQTKTWEGAEEEVVQQEQRQQTQQQAEQQKKHKDAESKVLQGQQQRNLQQLDKEKRTKTLSRSKVQSLTEEQSLLQLRRHLHAKQLQQQQMQHQQTQEKKVSGAHRVPQQQHHGKQKGLLPEQQQQDWEDGQSPQRQQQVKQLRHSAASPGQHVCLVKQQQSRVDRHVQRQPAGLQRQQQTPQPLAGGERERLSELLLLLSQYKDHLVRDYVQKQQLLETRQQPMKDAGTEEKKHQNQLMLVKKKEEEEKDAKQHRQRLQHQQHQQQLQRQQPQRQRPQSQQQMPQERSSVKRHLFMWRWLQQRRPCSVVCCCVLLVCFLAIGDSATSDSTAAAASRIFAPYWREADDAAATHAASVWFPSKPASPAVDAAPPSRLHERHPAALATSRDPTTTAEAARSVQETGGTPGGMHAGAVHANVRAAYRDLTSTADAPVAQLVTRNAAAGAAAATGASRHSEKTAAPLVAQRSTQSTYRDSVLPEASRGSSSAISKEIDSSGPQQPPSSTLQGRQNHDAPSRTMAASAGNVIAHSRAGEGRTAAAAAGAMRADHDRKGATARSITAEGHNNSVGGEAADRDRKRTLPRAAATVGGQRQVAPPTATAARGVAPCTQGVAATAVNTPRARGLLQEKATTAALLPAAATAAAQDAAEQKATESPTDFLSDVSDGREEPREKSRNTTTARAAGKDVGAAGLQHFATSQVERAEQAATRATRTGGTVVTAATEAARVATETWARICEEGQAAKGPEETTEEGFAPAAAARKATGIGANGTAAERSIEAVTDADIGSGAAGARANVEDPPAPPQGRRRTEQAAQSMETAAGAKSNITHRTVAPASAAATLEGKEAAAGSRERGKKEQERTRVAAYAGAAGRLLTAALEPPAEEREAKEEAEQDIVRDPPRAPAALGDGAGAAEAASPGRAGGREETAAAVAARTAAETATAAGAKGKVAAATRKDEEEGDGEDGEGGEGEGGDGTKRRKVDSDPIKLGEGGRAKEMMQMPDEPAEPTEPQRGRRSLWMPEERSFANSLSSVRQRLQHDSYAPSFMRKKQNLADVPSLSAIAQRSSTIRGTLTKELMDKQSVLFPRVYTPSKEIQMRTAELEILAKALVVLRSNVRLGILRVNEFYQLMAGRAQERSAAFRDRLSTMRDHQNDLLAAAMMNTLAEQAAAKVHLSAELDRAEVAQVYAVKFTQVKVAVQACEQHFTAIKVSLGELLKHKRRWEQEVQSFLSRLAETAEQREQLLLQQYLEKAQRLLQTKLEELSLVQRVPRADVQYFSLLLTQTASTFFSKHVVVADLSTLLNTPKARATAHELAAMMLNHLRSVNKKWKLMPIFIVNASSASELAPENYSLLHTLPGIETLQAALQLLRSRRTGYRRKFVLVTVDQLDVRCTLLVIRSGNVRRRFNDMDCAGSPEKEGVATLSLYRAGLLRRFLPDSEMHKELQYPFFKRNNEKIFLGYLGLRAALTEHGEAFAVSADRKQHVVHVTDALAAAGRRALQFLTFSASQTAELRSALAQLKEEVKFLVALEVACNKPLVFSTVEAQEAQALLGLSTPSVRGVYNTFPVEDLVTLVGFTTQPQPPVPLSSLFKSSVAIIRLELDRSVYGRREFAVPTRKAMLQGLSLLSAGAGDVLLLVTTEVTRDTRISYFRKKKAKVTTRLCTGGGRETALPINITLLPDIRNKYLTHEMVLRGIVEILCAYYLPQYVNKFPQLHHRAIYVQLIDKSANR